MPELGETEVPEKKSKQELLSSTGYFEFPSATVAEIIYHSFAHDEDAPRVRSEKMLELDGNRIKFSLSAKNQKALDKGVGSMTDCIKLSQEVLNAGSKFGGNLSEQEKSKLSNPVVPVFT